MLKLDRAYCAVGYAAPKGAQAWHRVNKPVQCSLVTVFVSKKRCVPYFEKPGRSVKSSPSCACYLFYLPGLGSFYSHSTDGRAMGAGKEAF
ncbi:hypothetical protein AB7M22_003292 [Pseudomonas sp. ADAK2 TE3594]